MEDHEQGLSSPFLTNTRRNHKGKNCTKWPTSSGRWRWGDDRTYSICLIEGVDDGTGATLARRFAQGGYRFAMPVRNRERFDAFEIEIADARGYVRDLAGLGAPHAAVEAVRANMGAPSVLVHTAVSAAPILAQLGLPGSIPGVCRIAGRARAINQSHVDCVDGRRALSVLVNLSVASRLWECGWNLPREWRAHAEDTSSRP